MVVLSNQSLFTGTPEDDEVSGTAGPEYFFGDDGNDTFRGLGGTDILRGSLGNDFIFGGAGADCVQGSDGDDELFGELGNDSVIGSGGNDLLDAGAGNDVLSGGEGRDVMIGGAGADLFVYWKATHSTAGAPDQIEDFAADELIDLSSIDAKTGTPGGQRFDFIGAAAFSAEGQIRVTSAGGRTLVEVNTSGSGGAEMAIELTNGASFGIDNLLLTGNPNDDSGSDEAIRGDGGDRDLPVPSADTISAGAGEDYIFGAELDDVISGGADNDIVRGSAGNDIVSGDEGHDVLDGGEGNDQLFGGDGRDLMRGLPGKDQLDGGEGNDFLDGGSSNDRLGGGGGDDVLLGGSGADQIAGGDGRDTFTWQNAKQGRDTILDYTAGFDRFQIEGALRGFNGSEAALDRFVRFVPASGAAGSILQVDADGGAAAWTDLALVQGVGGLQAQALFRSGGLLIDDLRPIPGRVDGLPYIASYGDLIQAFGANAAAGEQHYHDFGQAEGRSVTFNGLQYIAGYGDLIGAFGPNAAAGATHFITNGFAEGRTPDRFNEVQYAANYADLQAAFGTNYEAATQHFITNGFAEGRTDFLI